MIDTKIEEIYNKLITINIIKRMKTKNRFILVILPSFIMLLSLVISLIVIDRPLFLVFLTISIVMTFIVDSAVKNQMKEDYGKADSKEYYRCFEKELKNQNISITEIKKAKALFELDNTPVDYKFKKLFSSILAIIIIPTLFIHFNDRIANDIFFVFQIIFYTAVIPILVYPISAVFSYKYYRKTSIIKKIERYLILNDNKNKSM